MNTKQLQLFGAIALLFSTSGLALAGIPEPGSVGFNPDTSNVDVGDIFSVDIVGEFYELSGGRIDLGFDSTILRIDSVDIDPFFNWIPVGGGPAVGNIWPGIIFDVVPGDPAAMGIFTIATINMTAMAAGSSSLVILETSEFYDMYGSQLNPQLTNGTVNVSPIPVPAAVWLFGSGLLGLFGMARRKIV